jgi:hypothetical protein
MLLLLVLLCLQSIRQTIATGYKPDPTHRYEHKQDIEKLLHPNQEVHTVQYPPQDEVKRRQEEESYYYDDANFGTSSFHKEKTMMNAGFKTGYVQKKGSKPSANNMPFMHSMLVTNILDVSAAVERESVITEDDVGAGKH